MTELTKKLEIGKQFEEEKGSADAISAYEGIISYKFKNEDEITDDAIKAKEQACYRLAGIFVQLSLFDELVDLTKQILPLYKDLPKSKVAKIIRTLFDMAIRFPGKGRNVPLIDLSNHVIEWCT